MEGVLAVDLGATHTRVAVVGPRADILDRVEEHTRHRATYPNALFALISEMRSRHDVDRAVIGLPGRVDYRRGRLEYAPNLPSTWAADLTVERLGQVTGVVTAVANDADLAAAGEAHFGAGRDYKDVAFMIVSTGIGAGALLGGRVVAGGRSLAEIGHIVIDRKAFREGEAASVEELGAGPALAAAAASVGLRERARPLVGRAESGDLTIASAWREVTEAVALGAVALAHMFCPEVIVIGGGLGAGSQGMRAAVQLALASRGPQELEPPIQVVPALLGADAGLLGAAAWQRAAPHVRRP